MSNLGFQTVYRLFNAHDDIVCERFFLPPKQELVELALLKMEGYTNDEIAKRWQKAERTVERKLNLIRKIWAKYALPNH
jgi:DNA-binding NarL/FixJ family response regulator